MYTRIVGFLFLLLFFLEGHGQTIYKMATQRVEDCEGILLDSGNGDIQGNYDHNENYIFNICIPEATQIRLVFTSFCTEELFDVLKIYDGKDTLSNQIGGSYSGTQSPGVIFSTGNCLTLHFKSDENLTCTGWRAQWSVEIEDPVPALIQVSPESPSCSTKVLTVDFGQKIPCSDIIPSSFTLAGPVPVQVLQATALNCQGDSTVKAEVVLDEGLFKSGDYALSFLTTYVDVCGETWNLHSSDTLKVRDCPIEIELLAIKDSLCPGECGQISVNATGGDLQTYHYRWKDGFPDSPDPISVCPNQTRTYAVKVYDENNSPTAEDSITLFVRENPKLPQDTIVCQTVPPFILTAEPEGGIWSGRGIIDPDQGLFDPDSAGDGKHTIYYEDIYGCKSQMKIQVNGIDAGRDEAACTHAPAFSFIDYEPLGGTWSGSHVTNDGIFNPVESGPFTLTYYVNGCVDTKEVIVGSIDLSTALPQDSLCESEPDFALNFSPVGGVWKGTGITDTLLGIFSPMQARGGTHKLVYQLQGCKDSVHVTIRNISVGGFLSVCPDKDSIWLGDVDPDGGIWSGGGLLDPNLGIFDPSYSGQRDYNEVLRYTVNGCYAEKTILVRETRIGLDTAWFCTNDGRIPLDFENTNRSPYNGKWTGAGVLVPDNPGIFSPAIAGTGAHTLVYDANGCQDSMVIVVYGNPIVTDTSLCEFADPILLNSDRPGGKWYGTGVTDSLLGIFDPTLAGKGFHLVYYESPQGCLDSVEIEVFVPNTPLILNLNDTYCYVDSSIELSSTRPGGTFSGPGIINNSFNPMKAGPGEHVISYEYGSGACFVRTKSVTQVGLPLQAMAQVSTDTICRGGFAEIVAEGTGGLGNNYTYNWLNADGQGSRVIVRPQYSTTYQVVLNDGCSQSDTAEVFLAVKDGFQIDFAHGDTVCEGDIGYVVVELDPPGNYLINWDSEPPQQGDTLIAPSHFEYRVEIEDLNSGCMLEAHTDIPSYEFVYAAFSPNPNGECLTTLDPTMTFLNQSQGADSGIWDFGDGIQAPFRRNENPVHQYPQIGEYVVSLYVENNAGCWDTTQQMICVLPEAPRIYIPNSFSPNGDDINDSFEINGIGVIKFELLIFDKWGKVIFKSFDMQHSWDGTYQGLPVPAGTYTYYLNLIYQSDNPMIDYGPIPWWEQGYLHLIR